ncbi:5661_t:CDS:2 [Racocetra fulgida]|uniref:5661_t:CDS:1 n=1 Tax=Racocetra fulgida TaxID=60492 RepID=A0A9N9A6M5_9GLOM|nr:5661_t:CDS:2 [Racocetra fulgida]
MLNVESIHPINENISTSSQIENIDNTSENEEIIIAMSQNDNIAEISIELQSATELNEVEQELLRKFCTKMNDDSNIENEDEITHFFVLFLPPTDHENVAINNALNHLETERDRFLNAMFILLKWSEVDAVNLNKLESLKNPVVKVLAKHTGDQEAKKADSNIVKGLETQLLLAKDA